MVLWIGVDDTDSLTGMCTTFLATELAKELMHGFDILGYPRLVRLNPNIPWKTRGNGAICIRTGRGSGSSRVFGRFGSKVVRCYDRGDGNVDTGRVLEIVRQVVERWARFDDEMTNPGFVVLHKPPRAALYWKAVRGVVQKSDALEFASGLGCVREYKNGRGVIGALAATAWRPRDKTYEILAYRETSRWGTRRSVDSDSVVAMDRQFPSTFNNYDYAEARVAIVPRSPCPILYGIRGEDPADLVEASSVIRAEPVERWMLFETNQGTDDHVMPGPTTVPFSAGTFEGTVSSPPRTVRGGHVVFGVGPHEVVAYEPSKSFRGVVRGLASGDLVRLIASVRDHPPSLNLEKLGILNLAESFEKVSNPPCATCGKRMKSRGRSGGFRCPRCRATAPKSAAVYRLVKRQVQTGWYEPPVCSRRHLSKPTKRGPLADRDPSTPSALGSGFRPEPRELRNAAAHRTFVPLLSA